MATNKEGEMSNADMVAWITNVDAARVSLEERVEKLEAAQSAGANDGGVQALVHPTADAPPTGVDSMGMPRVV